MTALVHSWTPYSTDDLGDAGPIDNPSAGLPSEVLQIKDACSSGGLVGINRSYHYTFNADGSEPIVAWAIAEGASFWHSPRREKSSLGFDLHVCDHDYYELMIVGVRVTLAFRKPCEVCR
jgi:hypothetical protein